MVSPAEFRTSPLLVGLSRGPIQDLFHLHEVEEDDLTGELWNNISLDKLKTSHRKQLQHLCPLAELL